MTGRHELAKDGATWFWFPDQAEDDEPFPGFWVPQIQCDGYIPSIDGIAFSTEAECQTWIDEVTKASPVPPARVDGIAQAFDRVTVRLSDLRALLEAADSDCMSTDDLPDLLDRIDRLSVAAGFGGDGDDEDDA